MGGHEHVAGGGEFERDEIRKNRKIAAPATDRINVGTVTTMAFGAIFSHSV